MDAPRSPRVLVCADEPGVVYAVKVMMEANGVRVLATARSGAEAIVAARSADPDLVILDLALSGALGLRIVGAMRTAAPGAAVVVLSPFESLRPATVRAGALELVTFRDLRRLSLCVRHVLGAHPDTCECLVRLPDPKRGPLS